MVATEPFSLNPYPVQVYVAPSCPDSFTRRNSDIVKRERAAANRCDTTVLSNRKVTADGSTAQIKWPGVCDA